MSKRGRKEMYALSPMQEGMLVDSLNRQVASAYIQQFYCTIDGELDLDAFREAWATVINAHDVLRTRIVFEDDGTAKQEVVPSAAPQWSHHTLGIMGWGDEQIQELLTSELTAGVPLDRPPLMRMAVACGPSQCHFLWTFHHIILDRWSATEVLNEVFMLHRVLRGKEPIPPLVERRPYREFVESVSGNRGSEEGWHELFAGCEEAGRFPQTGNSSLWTGAHGYRRHETLEIDNSFVGECERLARREQATFAGLVDAAWAIVASRYSHKRQVCFGLTYSGRSPAFAGINDMVGLFINTLPVYVDVDPAQPARDFLRMVVDREFALTDFEQTPLHEIQRFTAAGVTGLFDSVIAHQRVGRQDEWRHQDPKIRINSHRFLGHTPRPLALVIERGEGARFSLMYGPEHRQQAAATMLQHLQHVLRDIVSSPEKQVGDVEMEDTGERMRAGRALPEEAPRYPEQTIESLFEEQVSRAPTGIAAKYGRRSVTYGALDHSADSVAAWLEHTGVAAQDTVAVCVPPSIEFLTALIGVLKARAAYVPTDLRWPHSRIVQIVTDSRARAIITTTDRRDGFREAGVPVLCIDDSAQLRSVPRRKERTGSRSLDELAYVMYTSGSTGPPKGVAITHRGVVRLVRGANYVHLGPDTRMAQLASTAFDASTFELWGALLNGGAVIGIDPLTALSGDALGRVIRKRAINTLFITTALLQELVRSGSSKWIGGLAQLLFGGERAEPEAIWALAAKNSSTAFLHMYGPTESTTFATCYRVNPYQKDFATLPIGTPIGGTSVYVLQHDMRPAPFGVVGELFIGGDGLAREYLGDPAGTMERFLPNPFVRCPGARLYRTGDLARVWQDGTLEFFGRVDRQLKIRGFRVEPGEIETALLHCDNVSDAVVSAQASATGQNELTAYVVPARAVGNFDVAAVLDSLKRTLPDYMIPGQIIPIAKVPLNVNGKVDYEAVRKAAAKGRPHAVTELARSNQVEQQVAKIWCDVLGRDSVDRDLNFFDAGGHSLLVIRLVARIRQAMDVEVSPLDVFDNPTLALLSKFVDINIKSCNSVQGPS